ncbi:MAG: restriction endonuclease subunit S [bacterium]|jgi:type I restriction enzyme S subunit|nr:restriction endonuclease subunit S [bacterium]
MKIPEGWRKFKFIDVAPLQRGFDLTNSQLKSGVYPVVYSNGINNYHSEYKVKAPGIVTGRSGTIGKVFIIEKDFWPHNTALWVTDFKGNHPKFIYYLILSLQFEKYLAGSGVPTLNRNDIHRITTFLPPLPEQKAIADILSTWDEAIEKTEKLIKEKERRFKANVQKLITNNCTKWNHLKPEKIFDSVTEKNFPDEELLSVTQDRGVIPRSMLEGRVMSPDGTTETYKLIKKGDFVISLRSFQGGIEYSEYRGIISPAYTVLRPKIEINKDFYKLFFKTYVFIEKYLNIAVIGIRDGKQISIPDFMTIKIPFPPLPEQKQIAETLNTAQDEINILKKLLEQYKKQKQGLMQKLLTGEWRVRNV